MVYGEVQQPLTVQEQVAVLLNGDSTDIFREIVEPFERQVCEAVVAHFNGNYVQASRVLGIARMTLRRKLGVKRPWGAIGRTGDHVPS